MQWNTSSWSECTRSLTNAVAQATRSASSLKRPGIRRHLLLARAQAQAPVGQLRYLRPRRIPPNADRSRFWARPRMGRPPLRRRVLSANNASFSSARQNVSLACALISGREHDALRTRSASKKGIRPDRYVDGRRRIRRQYPPLRAALLLHESYAVSSRTP